MVECAKEIEEFALVVNDRVVVRSASSESIQSIVYTEPTEEQALEDFEEDTDNTQPET